MATNRFNIKVGIRIDTKQADKALDNAIKSLDKKARDKNIAIKFKGDSKGIKDFGKEIDNTGKKVGILSKLMGGLEQSFTSALKKFSAWAIVGSIVLGIARSFREALSVLVELDLAFANLTIVSGATASELDKINDRAKILSDRLATARVEIINATTEFARAGFTIQESFILAENALIGANVGFTTIDQTAKFLIATIKAFNLEASDAQRITDNLFVTSKNTAITFDGLGEAILRSGNSFKEAGASLEESVALIAAANESIQDPTKVGTALKTITARLRGVGEEGGKLSAKLKGLLEDVGVEILDKTTGGFRNVYDILKDLSLVINDLDDLTKQNILEQLAGKRQINILTGLLNNFDVAIESVDDQLNAFGESANANAKVVETLESKLTKLKNSFNEFVDTVVSSDFLKLLVDGLTGVIKTLDFLAKNFKFTSLAASGLIITIQALTGTLAVSTGAITAFTLGITSIGVALKVAFPLIGAVALAIGGLVAITSDMVKSGEDRERINIQEKKSVEELEEAYNSLNERLAKPVDSEQIKRDLKILTDLYNDYKGALNELEEARNAENASTQEGIARTENANRAVLSAKNALENYGTSVENVTKDLQTLGAQYGQYSREAIELAQEQARVTKLLEGTLLNIPPALQKLVDSYQYLSDSQKGYVDTFLAEEKRRLEGELESIKTSLFARRQYAIALNQFETLTTDGGVGSLSDISSDQLLRLESTTDSLNNINDLINQTSGSIVKKIESEKKSTKSTVEATKSLSQQELTLNKINTEIAKNEQVVSRLEGKERIDKLKEIADLYGQREQAIKDLQEVQIKEAKTTDEVTSVIEENSIEIERNRTAVFKLRKEIDDFNKEELQTLIDKAGEELKEILDTQVEDLKAMAEQADKASQARIDAIDSEIDRLKLQNEQYQEQADRLKLIQSIEDLRAKKANIESQKTARIIQNAEDGFVFVVDPNELRKVNEEIKDAEQELAEFDRNLAFENNIRSLEAQKTQLENERRLEQESFNNRIADLENFQDTIVGLIDGNFDIQEGVVVEGMKAVGNAEKSGYASRLNEVNSFVSAYNAALSALRERPSIPAPTVSSAEVANVATPTKATTPIVSTVKKPNVSTGKTTTNNTTIGNVNITARNNETLEELISQANVIYKKY